MTPLGTRARILILPIILAVAALCTPIAFGQVGRPLPPQPGPITCSLGATPAGPSAPLTAIFSGSISGGAGGGYLWTLYFGDGGSVPGSGASVSAGYTYSGWGTYTATLDVTDVNANQGSCYARVTVGVVSLSDQVGVSDALVSSLGLRLSDSVTVADAFLTSLSQRLSDAISVGASSLASGGLMLKETLAVVDSALSGLGGFLRETIGLTQSISSTLAGGGGGPFGFYPVLLAGGGIAAVGAVILWWRFLRKP